MSFLWAAVAGLLAGVLSGWGIGGGSLLVIYMTAFAGLNQTEAQGINLLYFLPVSVSALYSHVKNGLVVWRAVLPAALAGAPMTLLAALVSTSMDTDMMRRVFGGFVILVGVSEIFRKERKPDADHQIDRK